MKLGVSITNYSWPGGQQALARHVVDLARQVDESLVDSFWVADHLLQTLGTFLTQTWLPHKRRHVRATTAYRYAWFVERYIDPAIGDIPLRRLRSDHLDQLYESLATTGGRTGTGLAPKTILEVHMIVRAALDVAVQRELVARNVAHGSRARRRPPTRAAARAWTADELRAFLIEARPHRLYPVLHLAAHTGMRRGEIVGLKWSDLDPRASRLSISRTLQNVGGSPVEFGVDAHQPAHRRPRSPHDARARPMAPPATSRGHALRARRLDVSATRAAGSSTLSP